MLATVPIRYFAGLLGALFLVVVAPAAARATRITITEYAGGVRIVYDLPRPVAALAIGGTAGQPPSDAIRLAEPGLAYREGRIVGAARFRRATLLIGPDTREEDARYSLLAPISGRGFVLFAPYVLPSSGPFRARLGLGGGRYRAVPDEEARGGYVLVGAEAVAAGPIRALRSANLPAAVESGLHRRIAALLAFYSERLHRGLGFRPLVVMTHVERPARPEQNGFRGDVTPNGVILLRFRGTMPDGRDEAARGRVTSFLAHELFHLWNVRRGDFPMSEAWLHEGSAEYFSWAAVSALWPAEISLEANLQNALNVCMAFLGRRPLSATGAEYAGLRYPCGALAQWIADVGARGDSDGRRTGFDIWARLVAQRSARAGYTLAGFRAAVADLAPGTSPLLGAFVESGLGWEALAPALTAQGADVAGGPPAPEGLRFAAARSIALSMCTEFGGAGHGGEGQYFTADCGDLGTLVHIVRVAGLDPMAEPERVYARVREACAARAELALVLRANGAAHERTIRCNMAAEAPVPDLRIRRALPLNPPVRSSP